MRGSKLKEMPLQPFNTAKSLEEAKSRFTQFGLPSLGKLMDPLDAALDDRTVYCIASGMAGLLLMPRPETVPGAPVKVRPVQRRVGANGEQQRFKVTRHTENSNVTSEPLTAEETIKAVLEAIELSGAWP